MTTLVLLEGESDVAAVRAAAETLDVGLADAELVALHGITNLRRALAGVDLDAVEVRGLCDAAEAGFVARVLRSLGWSPRTAEDLPGCGFWVCDADLEDELVRAAGPQRVLAALDRALLRRSFTTMTEQPAWVGRPFDAQVRRFIGAGSGRKLLFARTLTPDLPATDLPQPIAGLIGSLPGLSR